MNISHPDVPLSVQRPDYSELTYLPPHKANSFKEALHHPTEPEALLVALNEAVAYHAEHPGSPGKRYCTRTIAVFGEDTENPHAERRWYGALTDTPDLVEAVLNSPIQNGPHRTWKHDKTDKNIRHIIEEAQHTRRIVRLRERNWVRPAHQYKLEALDNRRIYASFLGDLDPGNQHFTFQLPSNTLLKKLGYEKNTVMLTAVTLVPAATGAYQIDAVKAMGWRGSGIAQAVIGHVPTFGTYLVPYVHAAVHFA